MIVCKKKKVRGGYLRIVHSHGYVIQYREDKGRYFGACGPFSKKEEALFHFNGMVERHNGRYQTFDECGDWLGNDRTAEEAFDSARCWLVETDFNERVLTEQLEAGKEVKVCAIDDEEFFVTIKKVEEFKNE